MPGCLGHAASIAHFFNAYDRGGEPRFLGMRGRSTQGEGRVDTTWALVWHFTAAGEIDRVLNLTADQHQMDAFIWANFALRPLPDRMADG